MPHDAAAVEQLVLIAIGGRLDDECSWVVSQAPLGLEESQPADVSQPVEPDLDPLVPGLWGAGEPPGIGVAVERLLQSPVLV